MTKEQEIKLAYSILKKYQLPISPILEYEINECLLHDDEVQMYVPIETLERTKKKTYEVTNDNDNQVKTGGCLGGRRKLKVEFPDGTVVFENVVADTLVRVIEKIGPARVEPLFLRADGAPLVCREWVPMYKSSQREIYGGWKVCTHCSTDRKYGIIKEINNMLHLGLEVSFV